MSLRFIFLLVLVLSVVACSETADSTTTTTSGVTTTGATPATTAPVVTTTTEAPATSTTLETTTTSTGPVVTVIDIVVAGGTVDRVERFDVPFGGAVRLTVTADVSDEIHLHGYDLHADVSPGSGAVLEFDATIPGVFEIEFEGSGVLVGELQVAP